MSSACSSRCVSASSVAGSRLPPPGGGRVGVGGWVGGRWGVGGGGEGGGGGGGGGGRGVGGGVGGGGGGGRVKGWRERSPVPAMARRPRPCPRQVAGQC